MSADIRRRKLGRPRAIREDLIPIVLSMYEGRLGYRAVARELHKQGISIDWSTVRRLIKTKLAGSSKNRGY